MWTCVSLQMWAIGISIVVIIIIIIIGECSCSKPIETYMALQRFSFSLANILNIDCHMVKT